MAIQTFSDLYSAISRYLGTGDSPTGESLAQAKSIVNNGYLRLINFHKWSHLVRHATLITVANSPEIALPEDFTERAGDRIEFDAGANYPPLESRSERQIRNFRVADASVSNPRFYALAPMPYSKETGNRYKLILHPTPSAAWTLHYSYRFAPEKLTDPNDVPIGAGNLASALLACCLAQAERTEDERSSTQESAAKERLAEAKAADTVLAPDRLGNAGAVERPCGRYIRDIDYS